MTREEAQAVIMNEQKCVDHASSGRCNRDCRNCDLVMDDKTINDAYSLAIKVLEQRWIPVTERLPEEGGFYICTCADGANIRVTFFRWQKRIRCWDKAGRRSYWKVLAWMPLPEPYREEDEQDDGR